MTCKDQETARKLIRQFKSEKGRHISSEDLEPQSPQYTVPEEGQACVKHEAPITTVRPPDGWVVNPDPWPQFINENRWRFVSDRQIVGRFRDKAILTRMEDCEVGDLVRASDNPCEVPPAGNMVGSYHFTRRTERITPDNGLTWKDEHFWERVA